MKEIRNKKPLKFDSKMYSFSPVFITSKLYWDGGIQTDSSLAEKAKFYYLSAKMSNVICDLITLVDERAYIGSSLCEYEKIYASWSDLKMYEIFREISGTIRDKRLYELVLPEDCGIVDLIVESNFRYLSHISFYLPKADVILLPTCHTEILVYAKDINKIRELVIPILEKHSSDGFQIFLKQDGDGSVIPNDR